MKRALVVLGLVACHGEGPRVGAAGSATPRDGGTLRLATHERVRTLDPAIQYDEVSTFAVHALFDTLVDYAPGGTTLVPKLAERWDISADGLVYRFTLRDGIKYSDGVAVRAVDVVTSLERARTTPDSPFGAFLVDVADGGVTASSERELEIRLARPNASFIYVMTMPFTTPQRAEHVAAVGERIRDIPLGTGPFKLQMWREGERLVLDRNPHYWESDRIHLAALELEELVPLDTQFMRFERGELDAIDKLAAPDLLWILNQPAWQPYVQRVSVMNAFGSRMNVQREPFNNVLVRRALNYALNKHHSVKLLAREADIAHGALPPGMPGRDDTLEPYPYDPVMARTLLAMAGYPNGFSVEYTVMAGEEGERLATSMQADLAAVGVRMTIRPVSLSTFATEMGKTDGPSFAKAAWLGDYPDPTTFLDAKFHSRSISDEFSNNDAFYVNPQLDALLDAARAERDENKRAAMYRRAERILYDDAPWIWDYHQKFTVVTQPYVKGFTPHPVWLRDYNRAWLDLEEAAR